VSRLELLHQSELIIIQNEDDQRAAGDRGSHGASSDWTSQHGDVVRATRLPRSTSTSARTFSAGLRERERVQEKGGSQRWGRERAAERSERKSDGKGEIEREKERERESLDACCCAILFVTVGASKTRRVAQCQQIWAHMPSKSPGAAAITA
jgi:hypothetical protein